MTVQPFDHSVSDPAKPVPYRPRPIEPTFFDGSGWSTWLLEDQRFVQRRPEVLSWVTEPLEEDVVLAGRITARLFASTTGQDADWVVKLIDVYPDLYREKPAMSGFQLMGHRIMVQVESSWFPIIDRNPQTWVTNIFEAKASDFKAQEHR